MARISAVTALRLHVTFLKGVVVVTPASAASKSLDGCRVMRPLRREMLSVSIFPRDAAEILASNTASLSGATTLPLPLQRVLQS